jgi:hypothetical protein
LASARCTTFCSIKTVAAVLRLVFISGTSPAKRV